jgi:P-type E1-E2 ATPase
MVPRKPVLALLIDEVLNPFYLFQVFSMVLWFSDGYEKYACCILVVSVLGVAENLYETITNINSIRKMAVYECPVEVFRRNQQGEKVKLQMSSKDLVPGDCAIVPENTFMPCDMVLLSGSCIVNESMLTGESVPVIKNGLT